jgi:high affinity Mn2+ porin
MRLFRKFLFGTLLAAPLPALADPPPAMPEGAYFGGHVGYLFGTASASLADPLGVATFGGSSAIGTLSGGVQAGYEHYFPSRWLLGVELDATFTDFMDFTQILSQRNSNAGSANEQLGYLATFRGRVGYDMGGWTPFLTGGLALATMRNSRTDFTTANEDATSNNLHLGYSVGGGVDYALDSRRSARLQYLYTHLGSTSYWFASTPAQYTSSYDLHRVEVGLNYHFGGDGKDKPHDGTGEERGPGSWEIHGQTTFIYQGYPAFSAPYDGPQSLPSIGQARNTYTGGVFIGVRLWQGGELYYNPELLQGFGLANTTGAAGFTNGEAQKSNFPFPRYSTSRLFLRQVFGLGGETEKIESDYGQLAGTYDVSRITVQAGRYSVHDLFDTNDYAQDGRIDFMNWSIWAAGAFDYAADKVGLTYGLTAELNQKDWAVRAGYFLVGDHPNSNVYSVNLFSTGAYNLEGERRYKLGEHPGVFKAGGWTHLTYSANYNDVTNLIAATGLDAPTATLQVQKVQPMWGYYLNLQQEIASDVGLFARWSWNDGQGQYSAFTDITSSLSAGLSIKGARWGRPDDTVGIAGAINTASAAFANYLSQGGLGILVGDGQLNYAPERVFETYYSLQVMKGMVATADYQLLSSPAYNQARGPVSVFSGRLRLSF